MKIAKLIIGIISIVLFALIAFQSCAVGLGNILLDNGELSGSAGLYLAFCMLIAGIVGICTRKGKFGGYVAGVFYILGGLIGIANVGNFSDLKIWSILSFIFAAVFILGSMFTKNEDDTPKDELTPTELLKLQKLLIGNSTESFILPEEQLYQMAQDRVSNGMRTIKESTAIMESTTDIETFFSKSNLIIDTYKMICKIEEFFSFDESPTEAYAKAISKFGSETKRFIFRHIQYVVETTKSLKTEEKISEYKKSHKTFQKHYDVISDENKLIIESEYKKLLQH